MKKGVEATFCSRLCFGSFTLWHRHVLRGEREGVNSGKNIRQKKLQNGTSSGASRFFRRAR